MSGELIGGIGGIILLLFVTYSGRYYASGFRVSSRGALQPRDSVPAELERAWRRDQLACDMYVTQLRVELPGCLAKSVLSSTCYGSCRSYTIPEWKAEISQTHMIENCKCCKPMQRRQYNVTLDCPRRREKTLEFPVRVFQRCMCRPCSDGNPEPELPYEFPM